MKEFKKYFAFTLVILLLFQGAVFAAGEENTAASKIMETTPITDQYTVNFTFPNKSYVEDTTIDVIILMDKSSVANLNTLQGEVASMVDEMISDLRPTGDPLGKLDIKVGVVWFCGYAFDATGGLLSLSDPDNVNKVKNSIQDYDSLSGSNFQGGLLLAKEILDEDIGVSPENKHLIIVSDFGSYMFNDPDHYGIQLAVPGTTTEYKGSKGLVRYIYRNDVYNYGSTNPIRYSSASASALRADDIEKLITNNILFSGEIPGDRIVDSMSYNWLTHIGPETGELPMIYDTNGSVNSGTLSTTYYNVPLLPTDLEYSADDVPTPFEKSIYHTGNTILDIKNEGYRLHAITTPYRPGSIQFNFMRAYQMWFSEYIGARYHITSTQDLVDYEDDQSIDLAFDNIKGNMFYELVSGKLVDYINIDDFAVLPIANREIPVYLKYGDTVFSENDGTITDIGTKKIIRYTDENINMGTKTYDFTLTYEYGILHPDDSRITTDKVMLEINSPVDITKPVSLHYGVKLIRSIVPGEYKVSPNHLAVFDYNNSLGENREVKLKNPEVSYAVKSGGSGGGTTRYSVTYDANGGTGNLIDENSPYKAGSSVTVLSSKGNINKVGYLFVKWNTKPDGSGMDYYPEDVFEINKDITLYAQYISEGVREPQPPDGPWKLDLENHYAYLVGYPDGTIRPNHNVTREEATSVFFRLLTESTRLSLLRYDNSFKDVDADRWSNVSISTLSFAGIIHGYPDNAYHPQASITRGEFAAIASRFDTTDINEQVEFTDTKGHWAEEEINRAACLGWIQGRPDGSFGPDEYITRGEMATFINHMLLRLVEDKNDLHSDMIVWPDNRDVEAWYYLDMQEATHSHDYERKDGLYEKWTKMTEGPNWIEYERKN